MEREGKARKGKVKRNETKPRQQQKEYTADVSEALLRVAALVGLGTKPTRDWFWEAKSCFDLGDAQLLSRGRTPRLAKLLYVIAPTLCSTVSDRVLTLTL